jgi:type I restriction enzyme, R subunit
MVRDHIAASLSIEPEDFDFEPFAQQGGLVGAHRAFGGELQGLLDELNARLTP